MKTKILTLSILALFLFSCKKKLTQFYIDYDSTLVIESSVGTFIPVSFSTPDVETNSNFEFENNDTRSDKIKSILLKDLILTINSPTNETFSFLKSVEVYISSPSHTEKKIAFKEGIPSNVGKQIICDLVDTDLKDFIKENQFKVRLVTITDETIPEDVYINVYTNFLVDAKIVRW